MTVNAGNPLIYSIDSRPGDSSQSSPSSLLKAHNNQSDREDKMNKITHALLTALAASCLTYSSLAAPSEHRLSAHDQKLLNASRSKGETTVTVLIATLPGAAKSVLDNIAALGGSVRYRDEGLG